MRSRRAKPGPRRRQPTAGEEFQMKLLLSVSRLIDALNERIGHIVYWLVLIMVLVSAGNATSRHVFSVASNASLELPWYLFPPHFLPFSAHPPPHNTHH